MRINKLIREEDLAKKKNLTVNEGDIPLVEDLREINRINEFDEIHKTFTYSLKNDNLETILRHRNLYKIKIKKDSIVAGKVEEVPKNGNGKANRHTLLPV